MTEQEKHDEIDAGLCFERTTIEGVACSRCQEITTVTCVWSGEWLCEKCIKKVNHANQKATQEIRTCSQERRKRTLEESDRQHKTGSPSELRDKRRDELQREEVWRKDLEALLHENSGIMQELRVERQDALCLRIQGI